jgi:threonine dehydrogenase-like Zn-dependent dehydrogenase
MLAAHLLGNSTVQVEEFPDPVPGEGQVLVRVKASGICGSEMHGFKGPNANAMNSGHECAGEVVEAADALDLGPGDRVGISGVWGCGECEWCDKGQHTYCDNRGFIAGTHSELVAAPEHMCYVLPDDMPFDVGVLVTGDGLGVPYHGNTHDPTRGGDVVAVIGLGPIGLGHVLVQAHYGARVIGLDLAPRRLGLARELGAAHAVNVDEGDPVEAVRELTQGMMCDKVIEAVGRQETLSLGPRLAGKGKTVIVCGEQGKAEISPGEDLIRRDIALRGTWFYHFCEIPDMIRLWRRGLAIDKLITHRLPLSEAQQGYDLMAAGESGKVMVEP